MFAAHHGQKRSRGFPLRSPDEMTLMPFCSTERPSLGRTMTSVAIASLPMNAPTAESYYQRPAPKSFSSAVVGPLAGPARATAYAADRLASSTALGQLNPRARPARLAPAGTSPAPLRATALSQATPGVRAGSVA